MRVWSKLGNSSPGRSWSYFEQVVSDTSPGEEYRLVPLQEELHLYDFYLDESALTTSDLDHYDPIDVVYEFVVAQGEKVTPIVINFQGTPDANLKVRLEYKNGTFHTSNVMFSHLRWELKKKKIKLLRSYRVIKKTNINDN